MPDDTTAADPRTLLAQALHYVDGATGAIAPPIHTSTTYARDASYEKIAGASYSRDDNPTYPPVERVIAALDGGAASLLFASGMASVSAVLDTVRPGRHVVAPATLYYGVTARMRQLQETRGIEVTTFDAEAPGALAAAIRPGETDLVWIEPLANPGWQVIDIAAAAEAAHAAGAALAVDATVTPGLTTRPLALGADIVFQSATKYLGGHSDVVAGALTTADPESRRWREIKETRDEGGAVLGPFEAWLLLRGMRTLALRWERACQNADAIARHFAGHPKLEAVLYPGLATHPGHDIAARQMTGGFGGMLSLKVRGDYAATQRVATSTKVILPATSLGGVETLIEHRKAIEPPDSPVPDNLLRLSVGIEAADDLIADLEQALAAV